MSTGSCPNIEPKSLRNRTRQTVTGLPHADSNGDRRNSVYPLTATSPLKAAHFRSILLETFPPFSMSDERGRLHKGQCERRCSALQRCTFWLE